MLHVAAFLVCDLFFVSSLADAGDDDGLDDDFDKIDGASVSTPASLKIDTVTSHSL